MPPTVPEDLEPLQREIYDTLEQRGACFFYDLLRATGNPKEQRVLTALWDLVWMGLVTNDSFTPLRSLGNAQKGRRRSAMETASGRWGLVSSLLYETASDTERLMAWTQTLMERYGVVSREAVVSEGLPGGFTPLYQTLRAMEETGRVRRGYFVEGLSGAQFAWSQTVDRLRSEVDLNAGKEPVVLSTPDPANPYGALLPWPDNAGRPRRAAGTHVILVEGHPVFFVEKGAKKIVTFPKVEEPEFLDAALRGLERIAQGVRGKSIRLLEVDGVAADQSPLNAALRAFGFREDYQGLLYMAGA